MEDPKVIYLGPACQKEGDGREWCEDDVWTQCECGCSSVRYMLESDAQSELAALREELARNTAYWDSTADMILKLRQSLAAAEQRNAQASSILNELRYDPRLWLMVSSDTALKIGEFLKAQPTESGASE